MITTIHIENLRGISEGRLEGLAPLTILTGPNACGKSTVLDALLIEEPEVYQHPRAIGQAARVLIANLRRGVQAVLTTHSLELIDAILGEADANDLEKTALMRLRLESGELTSSVRAGDDIRFARRELEKDLR